MNYDWVPLAAFIISIVSLLLTLFKYFLDWRQTRLNIDVTPYSAYQYPGSDKNFLEISFTNKTMHTVSITDLDFFVKSQDNLLNTERKSQLISKDEGTGEEFFSTSFPLNIGPYESQRVFVVVNALFAMWVHDLELTVYTNKGKETVNIPKESVEYKDFTEMF